MNLRVDHCVVVVIVVLDHVQLNREVVHKVVVHIVRGLLISEIFKVHMGAVALGRNILIRIGISLVIKKLT